MNNNRKNEKKKINKNFCQKYKFALIFLLMLKVQLEYGNFATFWSTFLPKRDYYFKKKKNNKSQIEILFEQKSCGLF